MSILTVSIPSLDPSFGIQIRSLQLPHGTPHRPPRGTQDSSGRWSSLHRTTYFNFAHRMQNLTARSSDQPTIMDARPDASHVLPRGMSGGGDSHPPSMFGKPTCGGAPHGTSEMLTRRARSEKWFQISE
jgi:hypothetical protein